MTATTTKANGIDISYDPEHEDTTYARRLAAAFDRGNDLVDRITTRGARGATVWVNGDPADSGAIDAPGGWSIENVFVTNSGTAAIRMRRDNWGGY